MFPSEIVPVSIFLSSLISHLLALVLFLAVVAIVQQNLSPAIVLLPVCMLVIGLLGVGIGWIAAALQVYLRDTAQVVTVVMTLWFWITPIMISEYKWHEFPRRAQFLLAANPLVYILRVYRGMLLGNSPALADLGIASAFAIAAFVLGGLFFRHLKRGFADVL
jgi:lipopolysaccharide transport system permease protein